jgi:hypothetical protein
LVKIQSIEKLFLHILIYSFLLLPLTYVLTLRSRNKVKAIIASYGLIFFCLLFFYNDIPKNYTKLYFTVYTFIEYIFFTYLIWLNTKSSTISKLIIVLSLLFTIFQLYYFFTSNLKVLDAVPIGIETILIFIYIFTFFYSSFIKNTSQYIFQNYCFWVSFGILIYLGGSFFFNILANNVTNIEKYWYLTYIAETIKNIFFTVSIFILSNKLYSINKNESTQPNLDMF